MGTTGTLIDHYRHGSLEQALLDIGSGLGGPARQLAGYGCHVTGVDLSGEYVAVAQALSARMGLDGSVAFRQGDAAVMDLEAASFDGATLLHVGMNIADKAALAAAAHRALKPGGFFAIYDVMQVGAGTIDFPVSWSTRPETSFVATPADYRAAQVHRKESGLEGSVACTRWRSSHDRFPPNAACTAGERNVAYWEPAPIGSMTRLAANQPSKPQGVCV